MKLLKIKAGWRFGEAQVAEELLRVCRLEGRIAMANWTPAGFVGLTFKTIASHVPAPPICRRR